MNLLPLVGFYWRRHGELEALVARGHSVDGSTHVVLDIASAAVPLLKRYYPALNANGMLDDALVTLRQVLTPSQSDDIALSPGPEPTP